jgi:hypothetical protein
MLRVAFGGGRCTSRCLANARTEGDRSRDQRLCVHEPRQRILASRPQESRVAHTVAVAARPRSHQMKQRVPVAMLARGHACPDDLVIEERAYLLHWPKEALITAHPGNVVGPAPAPTLHVEAIVLARELPDDEREPLRRGAIDCLIPPSCTDLLLRRVRARRRGLRHSCQRKPTQQHPAGARSGRQPTYRAGAADSRACSMLWRRSLSSMAEPQRDWRGCWPSARLACSHGPRTLSSRQARTRSTRTRPANLQPSRGLTSQEGSAPASHRSMPTGLREEKWLMGLE